MPPRLGAAPQTYNRSQKQIDPRRAAVHDYSFGRTTLTRWRSSGSPLTESIASLPDPIRLSFPEVERLCSLAHLPGRHEAKLASRLGPSPTGFERLLQNKESGGSRTPAPTFGNLPFGSDALRQS